MSKRSMLIPRMIRISALICMGMMLASVTTAQTPNVPESGDAAHANPAGGNQVETIVIFRHGEKPATGLGQITPQGFNRALGLVKVLPEKFGKPDALFAPDPREKVQDFGKLYNYIRPLATIEPLAISLGMPVQTPCGYRDIEELEDELCNPRYAQATIFVAWEHGYAQRAAADLVKRFGGNAKEVPSWPGGDYDSLYVVKIERSGGAQPKVTFVHDHENLDGQSKDMPASAK
uniref:Histidine phosphatase superfamily (Branch 1) n=1 Tax=uncultured organism TaxID=155900 RepID=A0A3G1QTG8_9ZZZZ|nr:hypothetical protein [uncultured organism]